MDAKLIKISDAVQSINRNLLLLQGDVTIEPQHEALENAMTAINSFEAGEMHAVRVAMEGLE